MKIKILSIILITFSLFSCHKKEKFGNKDKADLFREFIEKFKTIDLPFVYNENNIKLEKSHKLNSNSLDTLFIKADYPDETYCYGIIKDSSKYITLIFFFPADSFYPQIITFTKKGEKIDETPLSLSGCGGDCGLSRCSSWGILNKDFSIFCSDTMVYSYHCDEKGDSIPQSGETIIIIKTGNLNKEGNIRMNDEKRTEIKNIAP